MLRGSGRNLFTPSAVGLSGCAYIGTPREIHAFKVTGGSWQKAQTIKAAEPSHLELHPFLSILYVVHKVDLWDRLPRGAVSTYSIDQGLLRHERTQPLSLSATFPRHGKVSPDGQHLAVAAERGGIYNLFLIGPDGSLGSPTGIIKDFGLIDGTVHRSSQPAFVAWHPDGETLLTSDTGNGYTTSFKAGVDGLERISRSQMRKDFGASHLVIPRDGRRVYALDAEDGSILVQGLDRFAKKFTDEVRTFRQPRPGPAVMAACEKTHRIVTVESSAAVSALTTWQMNASNGDLEKLDQTKISEGQRALSIAATGDRLFGIAATSGAITEWQIDRTSGRLSAPVQVAQVDGAYSLSMSLQQRGDA
jgi:6-phosphogluconolactonase